MDNFCMEWLIKKLLDMRLYIFYWLSWKFAEKYFIRRNVRPTDFINWKWGVSNRRVQWMIDTLSSITFILMLIFRSISHYLSSPFLTIYKIFKHFHCYKLWESFTVIFPLWTVPFHIIWMHIRNKKYTT